IGQISIVSLRPKMGIGPSVDELSIDPDPVIDPLHTALQNVGNPKLLTDLAQVAIPRFFVLHHAGATDYFEVRYLRQIGEDLILNPFRKERGFRIRAQVFKGKNRDTFVRSECRLTLWNRGILRRI